LEFELSVVISFVAGVLSFLSPCVLAIAPAYIGYLSGVESIEKERKRVLWHTLLFVGGFSGIFFLMGIGASALGGVFLLYKDWFNRIAGAVIIVFALQVLGVLKIRLLYAEKRAQFKTNWAQLRSFVLGISFGLGWTPCVGPILGAILLYVSARAQIWEGGLMLAFYSLGLALPFILLGVGWGKVMQVLKRFQKRGRLVEIVSGGLLLFLGVLMLLNRLDFLVYWLGIGNLVSPEYLLIE